MNTTIVAISVNYTNARKVCNLIQEQEFETYQDLRNYLTIHLEIDEDLFEDEILENLFEKSLFDPEEIDVDNFIFKLL